MNPIHANLLQAIRDNPLPVHEFLFPHRHPQEAAEFHERLLRDWYTPRTKLVQTVFRGGAKSTLGEEAVCVLAGLSCVHNIPIIGSSETRAKERLEAIKHELTTNERLIGVFGDLGEGHAPIWQSSKVVLPNNVCIQALGWDQSMRGIKYLEWRPDFCWIDDIEDEENSKDPVSREKVVKRLMGTVLPAVDAPGARIRVTGSIIDPESFVVQLAKLPDWKSRVYPVKYLHPRTHQWTASWHARKSLEAIDKLEADYTAIGQKILFDREYMCRTVQDEDRSFKPSYMHSSPIPRTYQSTYAIYDPARTVNESSAHTGKVVASWSNNKLIVWESSGNFWMPDAIVRDIFETDTKYNTTLIGVEQDGLHEFLMQPIRHETVKRGQIIPIRPLKAPKGKLSFIRGLQPLFKAGEVIFVPDNEAHASLISQLVNFPTGRIDIPNALAYMLMVRIGQPMLDSFDTSVHIDPLLAVQRPYPLVLAVNSENKFTTGVLLQLVQSRYHILADYVLEGDPGATLSDLVNYASLEALHPFKVIAPPSHFSQYDTIGLRAAAVQVPIVVERGGEPQRGLEMARSALASLSHGRAGLLVSPAARWTLRAFTGGYARDPDKAGVLRAQPTANAYATLVDGLFSVIASSRFTQDLDNTRRYAHTSDGTPYLTARRV